MKVYLSIDLDYWCLSGSPDPFFRRVFKLGLPIFVAPFHDQLLPKINESGCDTVINVDYHSDMVDYPLPAEMMNECCLTEGSWANFIRWKDTGRFIWRYPSEVHHTDGYCHTDYNPFADPCHCGWKSTEMSEGLVGVPWRKIEAIGVCLSTDWLRKAPIEPITNRLGIKKWTRMSLQDQRVNAQPFFYTGA